jgi:SAM-dependent methyltransferase
VPLIDPSDLELRAIRSLAAFSGLRVIEIGAGDGRLAWPFATEAALWLALDPDGAELRHAALAALAAADMRANPVAPVRLLVADGRALPLPPASFDIAFFTWSLCCIPRADMALALVEAGRVLRAGGQLVDIHPAAEPLRLEAWTARGPITDLGAPDPRDFRRQRLGPLAPDETLGDFAAASAAVAGAGAGPGFKPVAARTFAYRYFFDNLDELTDYLDDNEELDLASDELLERALLALEQATTEARLVLVQPVIATCLRKT